MQNVIKGWMWYVEALCGLTLKLESSIYCDVKTFCLKTTVDYVHTLLLCVGKLRFKLFTH